MIVFQELLMLQGKEKRRRLRPGTLVMGTCAFPGEQPGVRPKVYGWYHTDLHIP